MLQLIFRSANNGLEDDHVLLQSTVIFSSVEWKTLTESKQLVLTDLKYLIIIEYVLNISLV